MPCPGGSIGAGLFVGTGSALSAGGPGALVGLSDQAGQGNAEANFIKLVCYLIVGAMLLLTIQALGELAVVYPENGAFFTYCVRFINPAWLVASIPSLGSLTYKPCINQ